MNIKIIGTLACLGLLTALVIYVPPLYDDTKATRIIQNIWNTTTETIALGTIVVTDNPNSSLAVKMKEKVSVIDQGTFLNFKAWEKVGIISISVDQQFEEYKQKEPMQFLGSQFDSYIIVPTEKGALANKTSGNLQTNTCVKVLQGNFSITKVIKSSKKNDGMNEYRLIMLKYTAKWTPEFLVFAQARGLPVNEKRKAIVLLKLDPFSNKWTIRASDYADEDAAFTTDVVSSALRNFPGNN